MNKEILLTPETGARLFCLPRTQHPRHGAERLDLRRTEIRSRKAARGRNPKVSENRNPDRLRRNAAGRQDQSQNARQLPV